MTERLLLCTDLDRTLIPNGKEAESAGAREHFAILAAHTEVMLAYVSGRHRTLVEQAIFEYTLPLPDFVIGDVGTTIYHVGSEREWQRQVDWETEIAQDWNGKSHADIESMLHDISALKLQEEEKQNRYKLSYYVNSGENQTVLETLIQSRFREDSVNARLVWSHDEAAGVELLDVLPARASKYHAIETLMRTQGFNYANTVFSGDSGNDLEVLASPVQSILVANCTSELRALAIQLSAEKAHPDQLYIARGGFMGMNGNYSAGILEGVAHYIPRSISWMGFAAGESG